MTVAAAEPQERAVEWAPHPGSQSLFITCQAYEVLMGGSRGGGKTDCLLMSFAQHVGNGYGADWRGILFRQSYPQLADIEAKTMRWWPRIFPEAKFTGGSSPEWTWPSGEKFMLRYINHPRDYRNYHGWETPWLGFEELTNWPDGECYTMLQSICRSSNPDVPRMIRATTNPYGPGHGWVRSRFIDPGPPLTNLNPEKAGRDRVYIPSSWKDNPSLYEADPEYIETLQADTNVARRDAWLEGRWDIVAGGMFDDIWRREVHVLDPFPIPSSWRIDRSFDWGSSKPFSVIWWAESDGTEATLRNGTTRQFPPGTLFAVTEWYGWNGQANEGCRMLAAEVARGILQRETFASIAHRVVSGPADSSIYTNENGMCIADDMNNVGVQWRPANKTPGSRINGWELMRRRLAASTKTPMEEPGLFLFNTCTHGIRTLPVAPRSDKNMDDVDTNSEDHWLDAARYRVLAQASDTYIGRSPF